jgi:GT2 family glycosyltransferase
MTPELRLDESTVLSPISSDCSLFLSALAAGSEAFFGALDRIDNNGAHGWIIQTGKESPPVIDVYYKNKLIGTGSPKFHRNDVEGALGLSTHSGFAITLALALQTTTKEALKRHLSVRLRGARAYLSLERTDLLDFADDTEADDLSREITRRVLERGFYSLDWIAAQRSKLADSAAQNSDLNGAALESILSDVDWSIVSPHPLFDSEYYLNQNPDVRQSGIHPLLHFLESGCEEDRDFSPLFSARMFQKYYTGSAPAENVLAFTRAETRIGTGWINQWFDADYYRRRYSIPPESDALSHFILVGAYEGLHPSQLFESLASNGAIVASGGPPEDVQSRGVDVVIPFYKNAYLAGLMLQSLKWMARELEAAAARIILINDSPEDDELTKALKSMPGRIGAVEVIYLENFANLGFVKSSNRGLEKARSDKRNAILLNSDALMTPGALSEILAVSALDPMTRFVTPRSNNATVATFPFAEDYVDKSLEDFWNDYNGVRGDLPRTTEVPVGVGFCLFINYLILAEFGLLDEGFGAGYYEENDLILKANRCGYQAVLANHAYVFHIGSASFSPAIRDEYQATNATLFHSRYPEFAGMAETYFQSPRRKVEALVQGRILRNGKPRLLLDLSALGAYFNGTFELACALVRAAEESWLAAFEVDVWAPLDAWDFHGLSTLKFRRIDPPAEVDEQSMPYAVGFRLWQPFTKAEVTALRAACCQVGYMMLDAIAVDCGYIADAEAVSIENLWRLVWETSDFLVYISTFGRQQFLRRFGNFPGPELVSYCSLALDDYVFRPVARAKELEHDNFVLIVGNQYYHKDVGKTFRVLASGTSSPIYAIWDRDLDLGNRKIFESGFISPNVIESLYQYCSCVVFPSHHEGFGFPILRGLAQGKRVFARRTPINEDLYIRLGKPKALELYERTSLLPDLVRGVNLQDPANGRVGRDRADAARHSWVSSAKEIGSFLSNIVSVFDYEASEKRNWLFQHLSV